MAALKSQAARQRVSTPAENFSRAWKPMGSARTPQPQHCPYCGADIEGHYAICPDCGRSLTADKCSFCGTAMKAAAKFCTQCGQPRAGIICPECGTLNSRNFCRKCNAPLTDMAQLARSDAENDTAFIAVRRKAEELADLHRRIEELRNNSAAPHQKFELSDSDKALLDEYSAVLGMISADTPAPEADPRPGTRTDFEDTSLSIDEIMKAYREKAAEMDAALAAMTPPAEFTPEQQRDYYSARKIATVKHEYDMTGYNPTQWQCNFCGAYHDNPSQCAEPQLGGKWVYFSPEQYIEENRGRISRRTSLNIE